MTSAPTGAPSVRPTSRPRRRWLRWAAGVVALVLVLAAVAGAAAWRQLRRPLPPLELHLSAPRLAPGGAGLTDAGSGLRTPRWPREGQAAVSLTSVGLLTSSPTQHPVPIGSVAKVMTAYLVLQQHPLRQGQPGPTVTVTAAQAANYGARGTSSESLLPVTTGEQLTERQLLDALLVPSANNAADLLATWCSGSVPAFVGRMNAAAARLGLHETRYADASGFDALTRSTAADQVRLAELALHDPLFVDVVSQRSVDLPLLGPARNYNALLGQPGVFGVKTGSTRPAGGNVVFAARRTVGTDLVTVVGAVLGQRVGEPALTALQDALDEGRRVLDDSFRSVHRVRLVRAGSIVGSVHAPWGPSSDVVVGRDVSLIEGPDATPVVTVVPAPTVPSRAGQAAGTLTVRLGAQRVDVPVLLTAPLPPPTDRWRLRRPW